MRQYFIHNGQSEEGPFDYEQLKLKQLKKDTPVWYEGLENWVTVGDVEELKIFVASNPIPPPLQKNTAPPPAIHQAPPHKSSSTTLPEDFTTDVGPAKKKRGLVVPLIVGIALAIAGVIAWLVYQNNQNSLTIDSLENKVSTQDEAIQTQQSAEAGKEAERKRINEANTLKNMNFRNNWENYIKFQNDEPDVDYTLGGIGSFRVYISNNTSYLLDQVDVDVQYIRKNGNIAQQETVTLLNVPAGASESAIAPSSINGVKVSCTISKIVSKKMHFCYPIDNGNPADPYFCK